MSDSIQNRTAERNADSTPAVYLVLRQVIWYAADLLELLLAARFLLRLFAADPASSFVRFLYALTAPWIAPFSGAFPALALEGAVVEWASILAMVAYLLAAILLARLLRLVFRQ